MAGELVINGVQVAGRPHDRTLAPYRNRLAGALGGVGEDREGVRLASSFVEIFLEPSYVAKFGKRTESIERHRS